MGSIKMLLSTDMYHGFFQFEVQSYKKRKKFYMCTTSIPFVGNIIDYSLRIFFVTTDSSVLIFST